MKRGTQPRQKKRIAEWWHWIYLEKVTMSTIYARKQLLQCGWPNDYWIISTSLHYDANDSPTDSRPGILWAVSVFCWAHSNPACSHNHVNVLRCRRSSFSEASVYKNSHSFKFCRLFLETYTYLNLKLRIIKLLRGIIYWYYSIDFWKCLIIIWNIYSAVYYGFS